MVNDKENKALETAKNSINISWHEKNGMYKFAESCISETNVLLARQKSLRAGNKAEAEKLSHLMDGIGPLCAEIYAAVLEDGYIFPTEADKQPDYVGGPTCMSPPNAEQSIAWKAKHFFGLPTDNTPIKPAIAGQAEKKLCLDAVAESYMSACMERKGNGMPLSENIMKLGAYIGVISVERAN